MRSGNLHCDSKPLKVRPNPLASSPGQALKATQRAGWLRNSPLHLQQEAPPTARTRGGHPLRSCSSCAPHPPPLPPCLLPPGAVAGGQTAVPRTAQSPVGAEAMARRVTSRPGSLRGGLAGLAPLSLSFPIGLPEFRKGTPVSADAWAPGSPGRGGAAEVAPPSHRAGREQGRAAAERGLAAWGHSLNPSSQQTAWAPDSPHFKEFRFFSP